MSLTTFPACRNLESWPKSAGRLDSYRTPSMKLRHLAVVAVVLLCASALTARAQGGGGGGGGGGRNAGPPKEKPHIVTSDSVERLNPISPLIEHRKDIGISDTLIGKFGGILARLDAANARMLQQVDSLAANPSAPVSISDDAALDDRNRTGQRPVSLEYLFADISKNNAAAANQALAMLTGKTADRAKRLIDDQRKRLDQLLRDSQVGRGRGR